MYSRPTLRLYVAPGCGSCHRAERALHGCERLQRLVDLEIVDFGVGGNGLAPGVIGVPTAVFLGKVVALGTPDCEALLERITGMLAER